MMFKDLRQGSPLFLIENVDGITVINANVHSISVPRFETLQSGQMASSRVFDLTLVVDGNQKMYVIPEMVSDKVVTPNGTIIICDEAGLVAELKRMKMSAETSLKEVDMLKRKISKCDDYLAKYDIAFKEKQENEEKAVPSGLFSGLQLGSRRAFPPTFHPAAAL